MTAVHARWRPFDRTALFLRVLAVATAALLAMAIWGNAFIRIGYRRLTGRQLDDAGLFERRLRRFGGQDGALLWSLLPFAALGLWWPGFLWLALYAAGTFAISLRRVFVRLQERPASARRTTAAADRRSVDAAVRVAQYRKQR